MPYVKQETRDMLDAELYPVNAGELNYIMTLLIKKYMEGKHVNYEFLNGIVGALECCKQEFYRRVLVPYEEQKRHENGDVY